MVLNLQSMVAGMKITVRELTTGLGADSFPFVLLSKSSRATCAAACSAALRLRKVEGESYLIPLTVTDALYFGLCGAPYLVV